MKRAIGSPTRAQQRRQDMIREIGCLCCALEGRIGEPTEIQHINVAGRNVGHDATFGLCAWHHRGISKNDLPTPAMTAAYGPSFAIDKADFRERYGTDDFLLTAQDLMLEKWRGA